MKTDKPIKELIENFIADLDKSEGTKKLYHKTLNYWADWSGRYCNDVRNITRADLIRYKQAIKDSGKSNATNDSYMSAVRKFFAWLQDEGYIEKNEAFKLIWSRDRHGLFIKQALTIDQVYKLRDYHDKQTAVSKRNYAMIDLMSFTGLRCVEVTRLNIGDIKKAAGSWHLQVWRKGKKEKSGVITVPYDRIKPIEEYWKYRSGILSDDSPVFVNQAPRSTNTRMTPVCISRIIKSSLISIGLNSNRYTAHSLRHTAATLAYYAGSESWEIGKLLGHSNPRQTDHYIHSLGIESADQGKATHRINDYALNWLKTTKNQKKTTI